MKTEINKESLLSTMIKNRDKHKIEYREAIEGYRAEVIKKLLNLIKKLKNKEIPNISIELPIPVNHVKDYNRVIKMIEADLRARIDLTEEEFTKYVLDDWSWKSLWSHTNALYSSSK